MIVTKTHFDFYVQRKVSLGKYKPKHRISVHSLIPTSESFSCDKHNDMVTLAAIIKNNKGSKQGIIARLTEIVKSTTSKNRKRLFTKVLAKLTVDNPRHKPNLSL